MFEVLDTRFQILYYTLSKRSTFCKLGIKQWVWWWYFIVQNKDPSTPFWS